MEVPMLEALKDLLKNEFDHLKYILHTKHVKGEKIPSSELEEANDIKVIKLLTGTYHPNHVQVLIDVLKDINRKDLAETLRRASETEKRKNKGQIVELEVSPTKRQRLSEPASYDGSYRLSDLETYAAKNQDHLIKQLEGYLEPNTMSKLKERLACSKLKNSFEFNAKQCYALYTNQELEKFLKKISKAEKSQNMPEKILSTLFSTIKSNNHERRAKDQKQNKDSSNSQLKWELLKQKGEPPVENKTESLCYGKSQNMPGKGISTLLSTIKSNNDDDDDEKRVKDHNQNKGNSNSQLECQQQEELSLENKTESLCDEKSQNMPEKGLSTLFPTIKSNNNNNNNEKRAKDHNQNKDNSNSHLECQQQEEPPVENKAKSLCDKAIRKWYNKKEVENCYFDVICVREHKKYSCLVAEDVILFRLPDDTEYCLLHILKNKKDLTSSGKLTKNTAFELKFNMAVVDVLSSDVISSVCDFSEMVQFELNCTFTEFEKFFKDIVSKIVLPLLALFKQVQVGLLQKTLDK